MKNVTVRSILDAPRPDVWAVLADFPNISSWNSGVKLSHATGDLVSGVGATRHCDIAPIGGLEETIRKWVPESKMVVSIDSATQIPVKQALATFSLEEAGAQTEVQIDYEFTANGGPLAGLLERAMSGQLEKGFSGFLEDLEKAAQDR